MDQTPTRGVKRLRNESSTTDNKDKTKKNKKTKKEKKKKSKHSDAAHKGGQDAALESSTATPEGRSMAQVLSTFQRSEVSRFEAFRRATFCGDAVADYVAHCLAEASERRATGRRVAKQYLGDAAAEIGVGRNNDNKNKKKHKNGGGGGGMGVVLPRRLEAALENDCAATKRRPPGCSGRGGGGGGGTKEKLSDMVAHNNAEEITIVVSTLAKAYAQRLVTAARRVASVTDTTNNNTNSYEDTPLRPQHLLEAHRHRLRAGLDPGFFLSASPQLNTAVSAAAAAAVGKDDNYRIRFDAALAAQEAYDKMQQEKEKNDKDETGSAVKVENNT